MVAREPWSALTRVVEAGAVVGARGDIGAHRLGAGRGAALLRQRAGASGAFTSRGIAAVHDRFIWNYITIQILGIILLHIFM